MAGGAETGWPLPPSVWLSPVLLSPGGPGVARRTRELVGTSKGPFPCRKPKGVFLQHLLWEPGEACGGACHCCSDPPVTGSFCSLLPSDSSAQSLPRSPQFRGSHRALGPPEPPCQGPDSHTPLFLQRRGRGLRGAVLPPVQAPQSCWFPRPFGSSLAAGTEGWFPASSHEALETSSPPFDVNIFILIFK